MIDFYLFIFFSKYLTMESLSPEEENLIKDMRNIFRLKKEQNYIAVKHVRNIFRLKKEIKGIKDIVLSNIKNLFQYEKEVNYYKPVWVSNFWSNNYIEYKSNGDTNKILSSEEYLDKIRPYLKVVINDPKQTDTWKIQLTITINFISTKDDNDEEHIMHSKFD